MDEAHELAQYLPLQFANQTEQDYMSFLWEAFRANCDSGSFQFAFLAYHLLTMAFVYCNIWQIRAAREVDFRKGMIGFQKNLEDSLQKAKSPFDFCAVNEASIMRVLRLIDCSDTEIGNYSALVKDRNKAAHCNGFVTYISQDSLRYKVREVLRHVRCIEQRSRPVVTELYSSFLTRSSDPETREYQDPHDQVREALVKAWYLSSSDVSMCLDFDMSTLDLRVDAPVARELHDALAADYGDYL